MKDNKITILGLLFFLLCAALGGAVYYLGERLSELHSRADELQQQRVDLESDTQALIAQRSVFNNAFKELERYSVNVAPDEMAFYSGVQQVLQNNAVEILSTRQQGVNAEGVSAIAMTVRGEYYALMDVFSAWRNLPTTVRVSNLTLGADKPVGAPGAPAEAPRGWIQADVTVEAIVAPKP